MSLPAFLRARGGWAHRAHAADAGWTRHRITKEVARGSVAVTARFWLHLPTVAPELLQAMRLGGRVTCLSALRTLGLWVPHRAFGKHHLAVHPHSGRSAPGTILHRHVGPVTPPPHALIDPIENVLARVATCLARADARAIWDSALNRDIVTTAHLRAVAWTSSVARELAMTASAAADSGLESLTIQRLAQCGVVALPQVPILGHPVDLLIGRTLVVQLDGLAFHQAADRRRDNAHDRRLRLAGYTVLRYDYVEIHEEWPRVEAEILRAMAQRLHLAR
jgi:very-short-patch-repair endonuclease